MRIAFRVFAVLSILLGSARGQGERVVADPHRFDEAIAAFVERDRENPPDTGQVLFLGSSSIRRWDTARAFAGIDSINRGFGGSQISDCIFFFDQVVLPHQPSVIVFYAGDNDINAGKSVDEVFGDFRAFAGLVRYHLPETRIVYIPIKPSIKRAALWADMNEVNLRIQKRSEREPLLYYADIASPMLETGMPPSPSLFADDGLHLSDAGNALWSRVIRPEIERALAQE